MVNTTSRGIRQEGSLGLFAPPSGYLLELLSLTSWVLSLQSVSKKLLQVLGGRWIRVMQFRRATMGILNYFWKWLARCHDDCRPNRGCLPSAVKEELIMCMTITPLLFADLRLTVDPEVSVSDASNNGGALCVSRGLTELGRTAALADQRLPVQVASESFLLISAFDGIGGVRRAWDLLGLPVGCYASYETNRETIRVTSAAWPDVIPLGDITEVSLPQLQHLRQKVRNPKWGLLAGGWPCIDMTRLKPDNVGVSGKSSGLVAYLLELWRLLKQTFPNTKGDFIYENVVTDLVEDLRAVSSAVGVVPLLLNSGDHSWCARPRLYWISWPLFEGFQGSLVKHKDYTVLSLPGCPGPISRWIDPNSQWETGEASSEARLPTFVRHIPRRNPHKTLRFGGAGANAILRWKQDKYAMPPYQYKRRFCIKRRSGKLTPPSATEGDGPPCG